MLCWPLLFNKLRMKKQFLMGAAIVLFKTYFKLIEFVVEVDVFYPQTSYKLNKLLSKQKSENTFKEVKKFW